MSALPVYEGWSENMVVAVYEDTKWGQLNLVKEGVQSIHPAAMGVQFGASVFEGFKIHRSNNTTANIFRIRENHARIMNSCERLCMPCPDFDMYFDAMELISSKVESWNAPFESDWLYVRPIIVAVDAHIMPVVSDKYALYILVAPIRKYEVPSFNLWVEDSYSRASTGGLGSAKTGANYAHQLLPTQQAKNKNCDAVLWLDSNNHSFIEECSTMNIFFRVGDKVITPSLKDTILPGITRKSVIEIMKNEGWLVEEREIKIEEVLEWICTDEFKEIFVSSTALGVRTVDSIYYKDKRIISSKDHSLSSELIDILDSVCKGELLPYIDWISPISIVGE